MQFKLKRVLYSKQMRNLIIIFFLIGICLSVFSQEAKEFSNTIFLNKLNNDTSYTELKKRIILEFADSRPGKWGEMVQGVFNSIGTEEKYAVFTFDACGGKNSNGFDKELTDFLHKEKVPATLFVTGKWIDANFKTFVNISHDTLFEIENHGLYHKPSSTNGRTIYGIKGTAGIDEAFDEIEANARKIKAITGHKPRFYRSATAYIDETCVKMAGELGIKVIGYKVISGDAVPFTSETVIEENVLKKIKPGAVVIMHFNHPEWNTYEAIRNIIPKLRKMGYTFVKLSDSEVSVK
jgi:peptidoglycan/xylan/chitin deacetylase (PgdA/CDA1 family)